jgi:deoxyribodipyrimidine photo-lyase
MTISSRPPDKGGPIIVWFQDDLRLSDHPALHAAAHAGAAVICLYVLDEHRGRPLGGAACWWLAGSLRALQARLQALGGRLVIRRGSTRKIIVEIAQQAGARAVYWNGVAEARQQWAAHELAAALKMVGVESGVFPGDLLAHPSAIRNREGDGIKVFTPFWRRLLALGEPVRPLPAPRSLRTPGGGIFSESLDDLGLEPVDPDWAGGLRETWQPGEQSALARLQQFLKNGIANYRQRRDRLDLDATSRLSPHLRFGEISPRQVWHSARLAAADRPDLSKDVDKFLSELGWREFYRHLLFDNPDIDTRNLRDSFDRFRWTGDDAALRSWQRGRTGYPVVDAGMRELWHTGFMHNRVRMIVASFLVKHLLIDWREGERWFWDTLVDADVGSNPANWQWVAGSGADAAPYFRIFNPILQGEKFDPGGAYVRRWIPELARLPSPLIHRPWTASPLQLSEAKVALGSTYPEPIIEHTAARERALAAYAEITGG